MSNLGNALIVVLASFLVGTFICGIAYLIEKILIWDIFLNEISDEKIKLLADVILHIFTFSIGFVVLYTMYKAGV
nr:MAG TPA: hypothetical protein [Caudoviricetes sp.]DAV81812.1 MAG TPA: hypothetical protein [Caudoviricetes sp.]